MSSATGPGHGSTEGVTAKPGCYPRLIASQSDASRTLVGSLTPSGHIDVQPDPGEGGPGLSAVAQRRIVAAFEPGRGQGVLHLGTRELATDLHPTLSYWRYIGQSFVAKVCGAVDPTDPTSLVMPEPDADELTSLAETAPPMRGAEGLTPALIGDLWSDLATALELETARHGSLQAYLKKQGSVWHVVGRVCFHLAENKRDLDRPFAFIATYVDRVSAQATPQHVPLGRALDVYAGAKNRKKLLALLAPLSRAAEKSELICELVESGEIYHPLRWSAAEAHRFLCETATYEQAGVVVRMPDWWNARQRPRPKVSVTVGGRAPAGFGLDAMLDFDAALTLDGERLSKEEIDALLAATEGLVLIKGRWVEVDHDQLSVMLAQWHDLQAHARAGGLSLGETMRLLAGAAIDGHTHAAAELPPEWSEVVAGKWLGSKLDTLRAPAVRRQIDVGAGLCAELRPYQKLGIEWLWTLRSLSLGGCLADDMGLGKTIQVLGVLALAKARSSREPGTDLLVVPASLVDNWLLEIARFAPQLRVLVAHPSRIQTAELKALPSSTVDAHDAVITTYGTALRTDWIRSHPWRHVVLDEAQAIKNPVAKQTKAVKALTSSWRLALTGTPVENRLGDLWSIFDFLNPGLLGSAKAFTAFCKTMAADSAGGYAPLRRLVQPYVLRRLKTDKTVIADLPDKTEVTAYCPLSKRQAALYAQSVKELATTIERVEGIERRGVVLAFLMRFKQICNHPSQWLGDGRYEPSDSGKLTRLTEVAESIASRQDKVLVFTQFKEMTPPLNTVLAEVFGRRGLVLHGGTAVRRRQQLVQRFQEDEHIPFMVLSLKAGGTGLNLTAASHVIHFDRWWNPAVEDQATDRAFRIGQKKNVLVHKFVCRGTVEERIDELITAKRSLSEEALTSGAESALTEMSNDELLAMVSLDLQSALAAG